MTLESVRFLNAGYCTQLAYLAGRPGWGLVRFHAVVVHLVHPTHGPALIDTGYGPHFFAATRRLPGRLYRWATPVRLGPRDHARGELEAHGLDSDAVRTIFVSHFHGDHVAGLRHFPRARFVYRRGAYESLMAEAPLQQVRHGFLADLVPADFVERGEPVAEKWERGTDGLEEFQVHDYWGDGSLLLVDLPGHAIGQVGFVLRTAAERIFYVVDATWDMAALRAGRPLPWLSRRFQDSYPDYADTQARLRRLEARGGYRLLACHCPETQRHVAPA